MKRHLRQIYFDPMTNSRDWGLIKQQDGGIIGVYSLSSDTPAKRANFQTDYATFDKAENYQGWKFTHTSSSAGGEGTQPPGDRKALPGSGLGSLQQNQSAAGMNTPPAVPVGQSPSGGDAF